MPEIKEMNGQGVAAEAAGPALPGANLHLMRGHLLARNVIWNLTGNGAPILVAVFCIPILIRGLGTDRFGVLALAWALIGYASLFDLGLGRALTQLVAKKLGAGEEGEIPSLAWTSLLLMLLLGLVGAAVVVLTSPWLVHGVLNVPGALQAETLRSFYLLGLSIPVVISTTGLRGLLEAYQRFGLINALRIPMGVFTFAGPLLVMPFSKSLFPVVAVLVAGRLIAWAAHLLLCLRVMPALRQRIAWQRSAIGPLLRFGTWMTVSNVVSPLMVTLDRFLIGALLSVAAVAYYVTPFELVTKLLLIPGALVAVLFPAFSTSFMQDRNRTALLYGRTVRFLLMGLFPVVLLIVVFAQDGLKLWLGADFAQNSGRVLQWLAVGVFLNCLAQVPFALVQGVGRPDLTAKLHLIELPVYLLALWWLISARGIEGAAIAWTGRVAVDAVVLLGFSHWLLRKSAPRIRRTVLGGSFALAVMFLSTFSRTESVKVSFLLAAVLGFTLAGWFLMFTPRERALMRSNLKPFQVFPSGS
jgi:O-antigen/teichoic acid export membrane protein